MSESYAFGQSAEQKAANYLKQNGYIVLEQNFRYRKAEIDIIAKKEEIIVCVEVKARSSSYFGAPESFVSRKKVELLVMAMDAYIQNKNISLEVRFDIITFLVQNGVWKCEHIEDAFYPF
ncbi:YraN family protein [Flavobacteriaceae bacterium]|nr:YraN family protein [Flavobacteriaceae bacterium]